MISREELLVQAGVFDLNEADVQRDYLFGWIISGLFAESTLRNTAVLKGGNALRRGYFPGTRFSDDLDFSVPHDLDPAAVLAQLNLVCDYASAGAAVRFDIDRNRLQSEQQIDQRRHVYKYRLYFEDMIGGRDHVTLSLRIDMTEYDRLHLPAQERALIHPYSDADACVVSLRCVKLEEALADKMKCLLQRRYCYDIFDLVYGAFTSRDVELDRSEMMSVFLRKTLFGRSPGAARSLLLDLPVELFRGYWHKVLVPAASRLSFDAAMAALRDGIAEMFAPYSQARGGELAFYPSRLRNLILEAGAGRKLVALTYDGVRRMIEPYSLVFKRRQDGVGQEYLYVYDLTGGRHSGPGVKTLFHHKIHDLEVLEDTFDPRFEMTLAKAGDASQTGVFSGGHHSPNWTSNRRPSKPRPYGVHCPICGRTFRRSTRSQVLNKHQNTWGSQCGGRRGYPV